MGMVVGLDWIVVEVRPRRDACLHVWYRDQLLAKAVVGAFRLTFRTQTGLLFLPLNESG